MADEESAKPQPNLFRNIANIAFQIIFPIIAGWFGFQAILERKASMRLKGGSSQGREVLMVGQDAIEFGIGLLLFALATHVLLYKRVMPAQYHAAIVWIFRVVACGGVIFWGLSSL